MLKLDPKSIFWSLAVHRYPKQPPRVIIFAAMGPGMKLVIDGNFLAKKKKSPVSWTARVPCVQKTPPHMELSHKPQIFLLHYF